MKIKRTEILKALKAVKPGLANNSIIKQMEYVMFTGQDLITYNEQISIIYPFETDFEAAVNYNDLYKIVSKIKKAEINLTLDENELLLTAEKTKAGLVIMDTEDIDSHLKGLRQQLPDESDLEWKAIPDDFIKGALLCIPAAAADKTQGVFTCLSVDGVDLVCSDNQRISWYTLQEDIGTEFFISSSSIKELAVMKIKQFCVSESWVHFLLDSDVIFSTRLIKPENGESLNYFLDLFDDFTGTTVELPDGLKEVVESAAVMAEDDAAKNMRITLRQGELLCETRKNRGWFEKPIDMDYDEEPITFQVSATFLQQILNLPLKMTAREDRSLFESGSFKHLLLHKVSKNE